MATFDIEPYTGKTAADATAYLNRLVDRLKYVLTHLDEENMTDAFRQGLPPGAASSR